MQNSRLRESNIQSDNIIKAFPDKRKQIIHIGQIYTKKTREIVQAEAKRCQMKMQKQKAEMKTNGKGKYVGKIK